MPSIQYSYYVSNMSVFFDLGRQRVFFFLKDGIFSKLSLNGTVYSGDNNEVKNKRDKNHLCTVALSNDSFHSTVNLEMAGTLGE